MKSIWATSVLLLGSSSLIEETAARLSRGRCPDIKNIENFDKTRYSGHWYEQMRDRSNPYTISTDCVTKEFALNEDGDLDLYFRGYYSLFFDYYGAEGTMYQCDEGSADTWTCQATMGKSPKRIPFNIFYTDYDNFDVNYSCSNVLGYFKKEQFSVATREKVMSEETKDKVEEFVKENLPQYYYQVVNGAFMLYKDVQGDEQCDYEWKFEDENHAASPNPNFLQ
eukprot:CAMPEP_0168618918 /NCGR_PEP_ID=MMETSP0449_2-20121227/6326_1 /TAXON_ID=1082188 /ORGANISM="Strombidium rassoulzadegani, Strain ras09" /LENGTH=223 /DNA_ID=CAMNT_0008659821 /DNA_START=23 /DNA_END=694 /DNA_ORIENTATION=-